MANCYLRSWNALEAKKDGKKLTLIDIIILLRSKLTHSEFQFSERHLGVSASSTGADGANGVREKFIPYDKHPKRWETVEIPFTDEQEDMLYREACELADVNPRQLTLQYKLHPDKIWQGAKHVKYDYQGILTHALKRSKKWWLNALRGLVWGWTLAVNPANDKFWCSEFCAYLIRMVHQLDGVAPDTLDPSELHALCVKCFSQGQVINHPANWQPIKNNED